MKNPRRAREYADERPAAKRERNHPKEIAVPVTGSSWDHNTSNELTMTSNITTLILGINQYIKKYVNYERVKRSHGAKKKMQLSSIPD